MRINNLIRPLTATLLLLLFSATANPTEIQSQQPQTVYICTGRYAKTYHAKNNCKGLNNCKARIKAISIAKVGKRKPCKICKP